MSIDIATLATIALLVTALTLQVLATLRVKRDGGSTAEQKGLQLRLIWLLPLIGAALVLAILHEEPPQGGASSGRQDQRAQDRAKHQREARDKQLSSRQRPPS